MEGRVQEDVAAGVHDLVDHRHREGDEAVAAQVEADHLLVDDVGLDGHLGAVREVDDLVGEGARGEDDDDGGYPAGPKQSLRHRRSPPSPRRPVESTESVPPVFGVDNRGSAATGSLRGWKTPRKMRRMRKIVTSLALAAASSIVAAGAPQPSTSASDKQVTIAVTVTPEAAAPG